MSLHALQHRLRQIGPAAIAVSGGIDSLTLACVAADLIPDSVIFHAVSPAVPEAATARVRTFAQDRGWHLNVIDAGEFSDMHYRANPVNRCFYCKTNLYGSIAAKTKSPILSGTNLDDLDDVRPGLIAAKDHNVQHPYVDAGIDKPGLRRIARDLGLGDIADLPAAPCLSSRVLTGLRIEPGELQAIDRVESRLRPMLPGADVRCRRLAGGYKLQVSADVLDRMQPSETEAILAAATAALGHEGTLLGLSSYRRGSAFVQ
ncbi:MULTISPECIES: hypothetical protein [Marinovum]|jgi:uncharacterized protein|uniref:Adenine nucleotide alpha hydrolase n=1 Tax=Marinovum algicola TaxID=42444 RepID=A0A975ZR74_9RHOB|nr:MULTISPECIES: hypothetical protein [Marinovum]MDD9739203.1 adenine nucleotide alpha hydrolase [Marinovum sp. SP66]SEK11819.1 uncharacterized protein SAMN04487940_1432 [Marinovum algicola]SLN77535.1 hypothetical protein MAA5396_05035 [Marinovum algicola]